MPIFKGCANKATPHKAIAYILNSEKTLERTSGENRKVWTSVTNLDPRRDFAEQFGETAKVWGKAQSERNRKHYHFKLSFSPEDNVTARDCHAIAERIAREKFGGYECVIATHNDQAHKHAHIIVNAVSFENGRMLRILNKDYAELKDFANALSAERGYSTVDFRKKQPQQAKNMTYHERNIILKGGTSWKEDLREVIDFAKLKSGNFAEFERVLNEHGVTLGRNTANTISYQHPDKKQPIRGEKLGAEYTKGAVENVFAERGRKNGVLTGERADYSENNSGLRERETPKSVGRNCGELSDIDKAVYGRTAQGRAEQAEIIRQQAERAERERERDKRKLEELLQRKQHAEREHKSRGWEYER